MMQFAQVLPNEQIVASVMRQLSWTHILQVLPLKDDLQREFYLTLGVRGLVHGTNKTAKGRCHVPCHLANLILEITGALGTQHTGSAKQACIFFAFPFGSSRYLCYLCKQ